jgi:hypothetical protein
MEKVKFLDPDYAVWKTKEGEISMAAMSEDHLARAKSVVTKRLNKLNNSLKINTDLALNIEQELKFRKEAQKVAIKDIADVVQGKRYILNDEIVIIEDIISCKQGLEESIKNSTLYGYVTVDNNE